MVDPAAQQAHCFNWDKSACQCWEAEEARTSMSCT